MTRRPPIFGPEPWRDGWVHWDRWMCLVAVEDHDGDLDSLEATFVDEIHDIHVSEAGEAKWSHLFDLRRRLDTAGLRPADLVADEDRADRILVAKARRKVGGTHIEGRAQSPAMVDTPRRILRRQALVGWWSSFPSSPWDPYERFRGSVELKGGVTAGRTFDKARSLEARLERLDRARLTVAERLALYRAMHTALVELIERSDDSYGVIGDLRERVWETYLGLPWRETDIEPEVYWRDLCGLVVWENYGLGFRRQTLPYAAVEVHEVAMVHEILSELEDELRSFHLRWHADEARCQPAWLAIASKKIGSFPEIAARIGSDHWIPIVDMAEAAIAVDEPQIAVDVFEAADRPGFHRAYLAEQRRRLTGR